MEITLLGTGTSVPDPRRVQSGVLVQGAGRSVLLDIGSGVLHRLTQLGTDLTSLDAVFISHFHIDHCSDFMTLYQSMWLAGRTDELCVYGPLQLMEWTGLMFDSAFTYLQSKFPLRPVPLDEVSETRLDPLTVRTCKTLHGPMDARAFRVELDGRSVVYTSDTAPCPEVVELARGCDVLVHECNWLDGHSPTGVHTSPSELAEVVREASPGTVVLVHVSPEVVASKDDVLSTVSGDTGVRAVLGEDLMRVSV